MLGKIFVSFSVSSRILTHYLFFQCKFDRIVCYLTNWSHKRPGQGQFNPEDLDPFLCTHVIYAFANLNSEFKLIPSEPSDESSDGKPGLYDRVLALKSKNPNLKISLAVGGWMMGPTPFKTLTESAYRQTLFTFNVIEFLRKKGFDGLDVCWEFPRGAEDKERYSKLLKVSSTPDSMTVAIEFISYSLYCTTFIPLGIARNF